MKNIKSNILLLFLLGVTVLLIAFSSDAKSGAAAGLSLAESIIVPSLLPLLIIFNLLTKSRVATPIENFFAPVTEGVLRLPRCCAQAVLFGMLGGYPTGAVLTNVLFENNDIDRETARRIMLFNVNGGAAFIVNAVGYSLLNNGRAGGILFASTTLSALFIAFAGAFFCKKPQIKQNSFCSCSISNALNESVEGAVSTVLSISAYIILFSAMDSVIKPPECLLPLLEITYGTAQNIKSLTLPELAFFLAFSGLCIHLQLMPYILKFGVSYLEFVAVRITHGALSYALCRVLLLIFPVETEVFSNYSKGVFEISSVNLSFSILMLLGFIVLIFEIEGKKTSVRAY